MFFNLHSVIDHHQSFPVISVFLFCFFIVISLKFALFSKSGPKSLIRAQASKAQGPIDFLRILIRAQASKAQGPIDFLRIIIIYLFIFFIFFIQPSGYFWGP